MAIASRLKAVLQNLTDNDQRGFLKGRSTAENIAWSTMSLHTQNQRIFPGSFSEGFLEVNKGFVDFEEAFDTIEWAFVAEKTLYHFGFGSSLIN